MVSFQFQELLPAFGILQVLSPLPGSFSPGSLAELQHLPSIGLRSNITYAKIISDYPIRSRPLTYCPQYHLVADMPCFIAPHFNAPHRCVFGKSKTRPSTSRKIMPCFIEILVLLQWSDSNLQSQRHAYISLEQ